VVDIGRDFFKLEVTAVFSDSGFGRLVAAGVIANGAVCVGDRLEVVHGERRTQVTCRGVEFVDRGSAASGTIGLMLPDLNEVDVARGTRPTTAATTM